MSRDYEGMDPEQYRRDLLDMGATEEDAAAAVGDLVERQAER